MGVSPNGEKKFERFARAGGGKGMGMGYYIYTIYILYHIYYTTLYFTAYLLSCHGIAIIKYVIYIYIYISDHTS